MTYFNEYPKEWQIGFQDPASPIMENIINVHDHVFLFLIFIFIFVLLILFEILYFFWFLFNQEWYNAYGLFFVSKIKYNNKFNTTISNVFNLQNKHVDKNKRYFKHRTINNSPWNLDKGLKLLNSIKLSHHTTIEIIWTIIPSIVLLLIAIPSFVLLYTVDEIIDPAITIKAIGHQWYWSYEYSDYKLDYDTIEFDSYMIPTSELEYEQLRLLEVDNKVILPIQTHIRLIITATDVLHSWAVPSLGVKTDAVPGRLNQASLFINRYGTFYGQCSEICGVNHGFMPIVVKGVSVSEYINWIVNKF